MRSQQKKAYASRNHECGMSLIEAMMGIAIMAVVALTMMSISKHGLDSQTAVKNTAAINDYAYEVRTNLSNSAVCTGNLNSLFGTTPVAPGMEVDVQRLVPYRADSTLIAGAAPLVSVGVEKDRVRLDRIKIKPTKQIYPDLALADVEMTFSPLVQGAGANSVLRKFSLAIALRAGQFHSCGSLEGTVGMDRDKICSLAGNGEQYYDEVTDSCKSKYSDKEECFDGISNPSSQSYTGSRFTARCAADTKFSYCSQIAGTDTALINRDFIGPDGQVTTEYATSAYKSTWNWKTQMCECKFATNVAGSDTWTCLACCKRQVIFP